MKHIVLSGYYGFDNAGDEAVLKSIVTDLYEKNPQLKLTVLSQNPKDTMINYRVKSINRWDIKAIYKSLKEADLLISGGGSLIQDVTSAHGFLYYLGIIVMAKLLKKPVMIYAQGLGPLKRTLSKWLTASVLRFVDEASFRDKDSFLLFQSLSKTMPKASLVFDPVLGYEKKPVAPILPEKTGDKKRLLFALRAWQGLSAELFSKVIEKLQQDYDIFLLPMHKEADTTFARQILKNGALEASLLRDNYSLDELLTLFGEVDLVASMRLHGLIMAANQNKPLLALSYDPKCASFMQAIDDDNIISIDELTVENLIYHIKLLDEPPYYSKNLAGYKALAKKSAEIAVNLVK